MTRFYIEDGTLCLTKPFPCHMTRTAALKQAIDKWGVIEKFHLTNPNGAKVRRIGSNSCALCQVYFARNSKFKRSPCTGCPIYEKTQQSGCLDTPYVGYSLAITSDEAAKAAREEVGFLRALLPSKTKRS
jgi:hypothetical protein